MCRRAWVVRPAQVGPTQFDRIAHPPRKALSGFRFSRWLTATREIYLATLLHKKNSVVGYLSLIFQIHFYQSFYIIFYQLFFYKKERNYSAKEHFFWFSIICYRHLYVPTSFAMFSDQFCAKSDKSPQKKWYDYLSGKQSIPKYSQLTEWINIFMFQIWPKF